MSAIDTLTVLIEADYRGLQTQLTSVIGVFKNLISQTNGLQIDWKKIFTAGASTALFSTIASVFAIAIVQALQFQSAMQQSSLSSNQSFAANSAAMSNSVYGVSDATGESANDIATALGTVQQVYKDTASAQQVLTVMADEANITNTTTAATAKILVPLFQNWGTAASAVGSNTADLNTAVKQGSISMSDLTGTLTDTGISMDKTGMSAGTVALQLAALTQTGLKGSTVVGVYQDIAGAIANNKAPLDMLLGGTGAVQKLVTQGGIPAAFAAIITKLQSLGGNAQIVGQMFGLTSDQINDMILDSAGAAKAATGVATAYHAAGGTINSQLADNLTSQKLLSIAWQNFKNDLGAFVLPSALKELENVATDTLVALDAIIKVVDDLNSKGLAGTLGAIGSKITSTGASGIANNTANVLSDPLLDAGTYGISGMLAEALKAIFPASSVASPTTGSNQGSTTTNSINISTTNSTINQAANNLVKVIQNAAITK